MRTASRVGVAVVVGVGVVAASCTRGTAPAPAPTRPTAALPTCQPEFRPPSAFGARSTFTVREPDHVGERVAYLDARGRRLVFASGVTGEFGEGEPVAGTLSVTTGQRARLLGRGSTWFLVWSGSPPCVTRAVIGNGLGQAGFVRVLQRSGVVAPTS
jgi:hypothetical protein